MGLNYVQGKIDLHVHATEKLDKQPEGYKDGDQYAHHHKCVTQVIDKNELRWRFDTAVDILCGGYSNTTGYYLGDAIGGLFV
jgi:hypothetical protein